VLMATPNYKEKGLKAFGPALAGAPEFQHVQHIVGDFMAALAAPVTEVATFKLKEGGDLNALQEHIAAFSSALNAASHGFAWGSCVEDPNIFVALIGWPSVDVFLPPPHLGISTENCPQAHKAAASGGQGGEIVAGLMAQGNISIKHCSMSKYT
jgi:hypothetical protein